MSLQSLGFQLCLIIYFFMGLPNLIRMLFVSSFLSLDELGWHTVSSGVTGPGFFSQGDLNLSPFVSLWFPIYNETSCFLLTALVRPTLSTGIQCSQLGEFSSRMALVFLSVFVWTALYHPTLCQNHTLIQ